MLIIVHNKVSVLQTPTPKQCQTKMHMFQSNPCGNWETRIYCTLWRDQDSLLYFTSVLALKILGYNVDCFFTTLDISNNNNIFISGTFTDSRQKHEPRMRYDIFFIIFLYLIPR
jgi:hypothetical protein